MESIRQAEKRRKDGRNMDRFLQDVFAVIEEYQMLSPGMAVIAGVSGGADSVCLLRCLIEWKRKNGPLDISVVHVEHGLRGEESLEDARFTEKLCRAYDIPCYTESIDAARIAGDNGMTLEEAGRYARYKIFECYRQKLHADVCALAHHAGDQAETVLMNLARGTGLRGLGGIAPVREQVIRPLLFETRTQIEDYLRRIGQNFKTDRTNLDTEFTRNKMRLEIIPAMENRINPETVRHICRAAETCRQAEQFLEEEAARRMKACVQVTQEEAVISCHAFLRQPPVMRSYIVRRVFFILRTGEGLKDITALHVDAVCRLAAGRTGARLDLPGFSAVRDYDRLKIIRQSSLEDKSTEKSEEAGSGRNRKPEDSGQKRKVIVIDTENGGEYECGSCRFMVRVIDGAQIPRDVFPDPGTPDQKALYRTPDVDRIPQKEYTKWLCCDKIKNTMCIRTRRPGDYFVTDADGRHQLLKKYMIDQKISRDRRADMLLIAEGSHILWMPGGRISEDVRVSRSMKKVLEITVVKHEEMRKENAE